MQIKNKGLCKTLFDLYLNDPVFFVEHALRLVTWSKMREILLSVKNHKRTVVYASHGVGKTLTAAAATIWFYNVFADSKIITTAPTANQVKNLLWTAIGDLYKKSSIQLEGECLTQMIKSVNPEHYALGFATNDQTKAEGFHAPNLLFILDEAKGIPQWMWNSVRGAMTGGNSKILAISTTDGVNVGEEFYKAIMQDTGNNWNKIHIDCTDTPFFTGELFQGVEIQNNDIFDFKKIKIEPEKLATKIQIAGPEYEMECRTEWGENSILYKTKARGQLVDDQIETIIPSGKVLQMFENFKNINPLEKDGVIDEAGVDVSRGLGDMTVFYGKKGFIIKKRESLSLTEPTDICDKLEIFAGYNKYCKIKIDDTGVGWAISSEMIKRGYRNIVKVLFNQVAKDAEKYPDAISEMFYEAEKVIQLYACEEDNILLNDLINRKRKLITKKGQRQVESKKEYKARGFKSPDRGDSLLLLLYDPSPVLTWKSSVV